MHVRAFALTLLLAATASAADPNSWVGKSVIVIGYNVGHGDEHRWRGGFRECVEHVEEGALIEPRERAVVRRPDRRAADRAWFDGRNEVPHVVTVRSAKAIFGRCD